MNYRLLFLLCSSIGLHAHDSFATVVTSYDYGYTRTDVPNDSVMGTRSVKYAAEHFAFLSIPANVTNTMQGTQITEVSFRLFSPTDAPVSADSATIVITNEMGAPALFAQRVATAGNDWVHVTLDTPYTLQTDQAIYVGYSIMTDGTDYPLCYYYTCPILAANATVDPILDYIGVIDKDGNFKSELLDALTWSSRRQTANLFLNCTLANPEGIPGNAVSIGTTSLSSGRYIHPGTQQQLNVTYTNTGIEPLSTVEVTLTHQGETIVSQQLTPSVPIQPMGEGSFSVSLPSEDIGLHNIGVTVDQPNGNSNAFTGSHELRERYLIYNDSVSRKVLLEHFTTGMCTNCVAGEAKVETALGKVDPSIEVIRVNHHSGFKEDKLTTPEDREYLWLYGENYVWAPANMIDRTDLTAYGAKGYGGTACDGPVFGTDKSVPMEQLITSAAGIRSFISLSASAHADDDRLLTVRVSAKSLYELPQPDLMRLNVVIVEDSVTAPQMLSDGSYNKYFAHYDVFRTCLTGTWGAPVSTEDAQIDADGKLLLCDTTLTYTIPDKWNREKLRIVAFVSDYDETNNKNCAVYNCIATPVYTPLNPQGLEQVRNDFQTSASFDLFGRPILGQRNRGEMIRDGRKLIIKN